MDWASLFRFEMNPLELVVRGSLMYWFIFLLFRFVLRRDVGSIAIADILLLVLIADASQNALAGGYTSVAEGCVLVATIAGWNYALDWAGYQFKFVRRFIEAPPLPLIRRGRVLRANLRQEMLTLDDLYAKLREQGIEDVQQVKAAFMESDGMISVVRDERRSAAPHEAPQRKPVT
ncbi:MAG TPA: YetF domain-containing protein [Burkholderiaceae bacterium]|nr:YetF domain-containing protein [Burkholderiaceae bacterium]